MRALSFPLKLLLAQLGLVLLLVAPTVGCGEGSQRRHNESELGCSASTSQELMPVPPLTTEDDGINFTTRAHWMRQANLALPSPCPFAAFGAVVVNHTNGEIGELICTGANNNSGSGNPTFHGEMRAIYNCSAMFVDPQGPYKMTPAEALAAFADLTLYTNAESCPMCASAIRWAGFKEYVYGTTIDTLVEKGWGQIHISSRHVFEQSSDLPRQTRLLGPVLTNETDVFFDWQFEPDAPCPQGCSRDQGQDVCSPA
ncbi:tRNA-specific adenosine deaminase TAD2 [Colletotrichum spaethianum]|uniref:tRNA-specific adenosine deaminase TAD2 n=1 Tax=Colletotrichum spaethianum TaxID=700344 RepID=A0AA37P4E7_9PEZI|nr:tRNA-specific adenosine deaminase TAD2 [Colletotrichum spaethianum]GKT41001.1 tRNA-specific adenosine deaminase TAD2 [Colletotrichum spaethianum]